jgi:AcrR family transcriptional regulator
MSISKREQLIRTAQKQFARNGFHAVGIDAILQGSGVARRTLYNHFRTKDELILAVLRYYDKNFRNRMMRVCRTLVSAGGLPWVPVRGRYQ